MIRQIVLTTIAKSDFEKITNYLNSEWGITITSQFIKRFEHICLLISESPEIFPFVHRKKSIRKCVLTKHNTIYFREHKEKIEIITIFDSRQDPDKWEALL